ncbi:hypothetical protein [Paenibacillus sanguinis]|uniref:hypothetical protein n=1 Tax=Paenibacillus sanguinis TaxID=225906 RepID=UPI00035E2D6B|nr:hypothetical protein [Paenibacillus sanguinis]
MAGLNDTDILLNEDWQLAPAANGDALVVSGPDCFFQDIRLEAMTQEGELFYDETWGWSLLDFIQSTDDELTRLELAQRVQLKLSRREEINSETIAANVQFADDKIGVQISFKFQGDDLQYQLDIELDRVKVEVKIV